MLKSLSRWERTLYLLILVAAVLSRFVMLGDRAISHDESIHTKFSWNLYAGEGFQHNPMMHGPLLFEATALSYFLFGVNDFTARLFVALLGVLLVLSPILFRKWLSPAGAAAAALLLLISPSISYYSRYIRHDVPLMLTAVLLLWVCLQYLDRGKPGWLYFLAGVFATMYATKEASYIYTAIFGGLLALPFIWQVARIRWERPRLQSVLLIVLALAALSVFVLGWSFRDVSSTEVPLDDAGNSHAVELSIPVWGRAASAAALILGLVAVVVIYYGVGSAAMADLRLFDLLMVIGTLTLPLGSALLIRFVLGMDMDVVYEAVRTGNFGAIPPQTLVQMSAVVLSVLGLSIALGIWWNRRLWLRIGAIHYVIFLVLYTTIFTWGFGALSGLIGGLAYWLAQHGVRRGNQPMYYYFFVGGLYEYLPIVGSVGALGTLGVRWISSVFGRGAEDQEEGTPSLPALDLKQLFPAFLLGWTVLSWAAYTLAGEKMPWLLVHIALPSLMLTAWWIGFLVARVRESDIPVGGLLLFGVGLVFFAVSLVTLGQSTAHLVRLIREGVSPAGFSLSQQGAWGQALGALFVAGISGLLMVWASRRSTLRRMSRGQAVGSLALAVLGALGLLTVRTGWMLNYEYPGLAKEFLVYAHGTPDIKVALEQIEEVSWRTTGTAHNVQVAYSEDGSWPFAWYMVDYPNNYFYSTSPDAERLLECPVVIAGQPQYEAVESILGDDYVHLDYLYLWWPIQDYYDLSLARIRDALRDPEMRAALWDIAWDRDYRAYANLKNPESPFTLHTWPYRKEFRLYIRQEVAQTMDLPPEVSGGGAPARPEPTALPDPFNAGARTLPLVDQRALPGAVIRGLARAEEGRIYAADTANHRIWILEPDGAVRAIGEYGEGPGQFIEPWDVAVDSDGNLYVADTWNHRIQKFDASGQFVRAWGDLVQIRDLGVPTSQGLFYGPRGLAVSSDGELYVADTGNKRVQVFDLDGTFLREFGGRGSGAGQLDEPVGISINGAGLIAVADTWNRRVQLFSADGVVIRQWSIPTWDVTNPDEKPFVALTETDLYVSDPLHRRVLAFSVEGDFRWALGASAGATLSFPQGVMIDGSTLRVGDAHTGEVKTYELP